MWAPTGDSHEFGACQPQYPSHLCPSTRGCHQQCLEQTLRKNSFVVILNLSFWCSFVKKNVSKLAFPSSITMKSKNKAQKCRLNAQLLKKLLWMKWTEPNVKPECINRCWPITAKHSILLSNSYKIIQTAASRMWHVENWLSTWTM